MKLKKMMIVVSDIEKSKKFYKQILGLHVLLDFGSNVTLTNGICLHTLETWKDCIHKDNEDIHLLNHACELCFEVEDIDEFLIKLNQYNVVLLHGIKEYGWGQRIIRFYDLDGHIIEVGECLKKIARRFLNQGLSHEEISKKMNIPLKLVKKITHG